MSPAGSPLLASLAFLAAVSVFVLFQEAGLRLRRAERRAWWAGSGRDLLNAAGVSVIAVTLRFRGFPLPDAFAVGATLTLALFGVVVLLESAIRPPHQRIWALGVAGFCALPIALWPEPVLSFCQALAGSLFSA